MRSLLAAAREPEKVVDDPEALSAAFDTVDALIRQVRSKGLRRSEPITVQQALKASVMILDFHLSGFDWRKEQASHWACTARMLAALCVALADTVGVPKGETPLNSNRRS
jgi:hypothetical protein